MSDAELVTLGATTITKGIPRTQAVVPVGDETSDVEPIGDLESFQCLGLTAVAYPADSNGWAEGIALRDVPGKNGVIVGARDTRTADIVGNAKPGDTIVHSTGPKKSAQLQLKEEKKQAVLVTKDSQNRTMAIVMDGKNDKVQIAALGAMFEIDKKGNLSISAGGATLLMQDGTIYLVGKVVLGGMSPTLTMVAGTSGPAAIAVPGVFAGT